MTDPAQRDFAIFRRGELRTQILDDWRIGLSTQVDPATGQPWAADDIARALREGSRWYIEADAIDLVCLMLQARAVFLSEQVRIDHASSEWLEYWCSLWGIKRLSAVGGVGPASAKANSGTVFVGSTTIGDPLAQLATDEAGQTFQLLQSATADVSGNVDLVFYGVDAGEQTNIKAPSKLTWKAPPLGAIGDVTTGADFAGGLNDENDRDLSRRLVLRIRHKPACGNRAQFRAWARDSSNAIEDAFVYACALYSGTVRVAVVQKRGSSVGPLARIPNLATLSTATSYLVPPASPVVPANVLVSVSGVTAVPGDFSLSLLMPRGSEAGWLDAKPWPSPDPSLHYAAIGMIPSDQTHITITSATALPAGNPLPKLMAWDSSKSVFEALVVSSVTPIGGIYYDVVLSQPPSFTVGLGTWISPGAGPADLIAQACSDYFDSLGPGELVNLDTDDRAHRALRFPVPSEEFPSRKTRSILNYIGDSLGPLLADSDIILQGSTVQTEPADPILAPLMFVCGKIGVYPET